MYLNIALPDLSYIYNWIKTIIKWHFKYYIIYKRGLILENTYIHHDAILKKNGPNHYPQIFNLNLTTYFNKKVNELRMSTVEDSDLTHFFFHF